ncbi:MAG: hypothetical protein ABEK16_02215 [Candidatus Nanohalobium sp.]
MDREKWLKVEISVVAAIFLTRAVIGVYNTTVSDAVTGSPAEAIFPTLILSIGFAFIARGMVERNAWGFVGGLVGASGLLVSDFLFTAAGYPQPLAEFTIDILVIMYLAYRRDEFNKSLS